MFKEMDSIIDEIPGSDRFKDMETIYHDEYE